jgi:hypothetical protein
MFVKNIILDIMLIFRNNVLCRWMEACLSVCNEGYRCFYDLKKHTIKCKGLWLHESKICTKQFVWISGINTYPSGKIVTS